MFIRIDLQTKLQFNNLQIWGQASLNMHAYTHFASALTQIVQYCLLSCVKKSIQVQSSILKVAYLETPKYTTMLPITMFDKNQRTSSTFNLEGWLPWNTYINTYMCGFVSKRTFVLQDWSLKQQFQTEWKFNDEVSN